MGTGRRGDTIKLEATVALALISMATSMTSDAAARMPAEAVIDCLAIEAATERLTCFDREARKLIQPRFAGRLSLVTERFEVDAPTRLRFQSDGAIFVLYLKSDSGEVVQNLHIGGGGEASYVIERSGTYFLQVNGSESWRIWIEPIAQPQSN